MARTTTSPELSPTRIWTGVPPSRWISSAYFFALLHPERRVAGPHGVIFMGERRAEQRHDPVAHDLVDGALVPMHRFHHALEDWIKQFARLFGIAVGEEFH